MEKARQIIEDSWALEEILAILSTIDVVDIPAFLEALAGARL